MNWTEMRTNWAILSPTLPTWWPKLHEDDLPRIAGNRDKLAEVLCERYGLRAEEAENQICAFEKEVRLPVQ